MDRAELIAKAKTEAEREATGGDESRWRLGELAAEWSRAGETDQSLATEIGRGKATITHTRLTWERFGTCRRTGLSWAHHKAVYSHPRADELLEKSLKEGLSVRQLQREINRTRRRDQMAQVSAALRTLRRISPAIEHSQQVVIANRLRHLETALRLRHESATLPPS